MTWQCRLIEVTPEMREEDLRPGDMFFADYSDKFRDDDGIIDWPMWAANEKTLSDFYRKNNAHRPPLIIWLPGHVLFCIDGMCFTGEQGYYGGWTVSGEAPNITVTPSINVGGSYHGFLQNGVLTDDCEGRKYDETGRGIR